MSTYYYFKCKKCNRVGGFFSRQAWGWGNFDIIESFKFITYHISKCGEQSIGVISENDDDYLEDTDQDIINFLNNSREHFPSSNDWSFMEEHRGLSVEDIDKAWVDNKLKGVRVNPSVYLSGSIENLETVVGNNFSYRAVLRLSNNKTIRIMGSDMTIPVENVQYEILGRPVYSDNEEDYLVVQSLKETKKSG